MENVGWGLQITALGMGLVFALLALLWGLLSLVLALDATGGRQPEAAQEDATDAALPPERVAAIAVAVLRHRRYLRHRSSPTPRNDEAQSVDPDNMSLANPWLMAGRMRQIDNWQPGRK